MARTRVAPLKSQTLPRLELMAATIAKRLAMFIQSPLITLYKLSVKLWSDSQIVLHWLNSQKKLKPFVASRVQEIIEEFPATTWRYVPTSDNPADLLTRGISAGSLATSTIWRHGPPWLTDHSQWPVWNHTEVLHLQAANIEGEQLTADTELGDVQPQGGLHHIIDIAAYNSLNKLLGVTAYVLRFVSNLKSSISRRSGPLSPQELNKAKLAWISDCQKQNFSKEIINLTSKSGNQQPLVHQLCLFLDKGSFICCGGRIHNAPVTELMKFPCLLPRSHPFTMLIVQDAHVKQCHAGWNKQHNHSHKTG